MCIFSTSLSDTKKQELSREKLLSKLLMTIQSFTYSCCCEAFDARQALQQNSLSLRHENLQKVYSKFGIHGALFNGRVLLLPVPSSTIDDGSQPFNGRIGRLRYFALAVMAAAGAVSADLVQLAMAFPHEVPSHNSKDSVSEKPDRAPIAYPILLGNVLTHVVAAMCASCGWARAQSDSLELDWLVPFSIEGRSFFSENGKIDPKHDHSVVEDCEGFMKLGLLARILQVLLAALDLVPNEMESFLSKLVALRKLCSNFPTNMPDHQKAWIRTCLSLLEVALGDRRLPESTDEALSCKDQLIDQLSDACVTAASAACSFLVDISTIFQVLVPGVMVRYNCSSNGTAPLEQESDSSLAMFEELSGLFGIEPVLDMLQSSLVRNIIIEWFNTAHEHTLAYVRRPDIPVGDSSSALQSRLLRTQGFRLYDWPMQSLFDWKCFSQTKTSTNTVKWNKKRAAVEPQDESNVNVMQTEFIQYPTRCQTPAAGMQRWQTSASLVTFSSKKTVPLFGGHRCDLFSKANDRPRIAVIPTSYTDLYAELGALLPECEQIAVCFVCGDVLNAGGKGECTRHSYKCGAGAGLFFLLQECSGLIMHMGKAAYIHSPYVDSHGETPQYRGRPLNLDFTRYEHLREVWLGHKVRQQVLAERGSARQVIVPDFY